MNGRESAEKLVLIMEKECRLLERFNTVFADMRNALYSKNWQELEVSIKEMRLVSENIEKTEKKRVKLIEKIPEESVIEALRGTESAEKYKKIKMELKTLLVLVKSRLKGVQTYASVRSELGKEILEEITPSAKVYDKRGLKTSSAENAPLVVSHRL